MKIAIFLLLVTGLALSSIIELTDSNFDEITKDGKWLLKFYAPWCHHCQKLAPVLEKAADIIDREHPGLKIGTVDCTVQKDLAGRFNIQAYPTLKYFRDSYASDYEGGRSLGDILKFANKVLGDAVLKAADEKQAIKLAAGAPVIFVLSSRDEQKIIDFTRIAQKFQDTLTFAIINSDEETLKWISDAEETYRGDFEYAAMESWILQKRLPLYPSIDGFKWKILTERKKKMVLAAIDVKHPDHQKFSTIIKNIALENTQYSFGYIDTNEYSKFVSNYLDQSEVPHIIVVDPTTYNFWYNSSVPRDTESIEIYLKAIQEGKVTPSGSHGYIDRAMRAFSAFLATAYENPIYSSVLGISVLVLVVGAIYIAFSGGEELVEDKKEKTE